MLVKILKPTFEIGGKFAPEIFARVSLELLFRPMTPKKQTVPDFWLKGREIKTVSGCECRLFGNSPRTVVIVHGWKSAGSRFKRMIDFLVQNKFQVLVWNGPAHGQSPGRRTHLAEFSRTLHGDLKNLPFAYEAIIGHSFGGAAAAIACKYGIDAKKLILISAPSNARDVFERYLAWIGVRGKARTKFFDLAEKDLNCSLEELSSVTFVEKLNQDVLVIHDEKDRLVPVSDAHCVLEKKSNARTLLTNGLGHHFILESPKVYAAILEFLELGQ